VEVNLSGDYHGVDLQITKEIEPLITIDITPLGDFYPFSPRFAG
jgi:hypothetical protein